MTKSLSLVCALVTTFIWGTAFIAQDTGMDNIGPLTFNAARFLVGFIAILPFAILFEKKKIISQINVNKKKFFKYLVFMGFHYFWAHLCNKPLFNTQTLQMLLFLLFFMYL